MIKKTICLGLVSILSLCIFSGCGNTNNYNAQIYDRALDWMTDEYREENITKNSMVSESESAPGTIVHKISSQDEFERAFAIFPPQIDFEKEMLVLYFFTGDIIVNTLTDDRIFSYRIKDLKILNEELNIVFAKKKLANGPTGSPPTQECLVVKMTAMETKKIEVELVNE